MGRAFRKSELTVSCESSTRGRNLAGVLLSIVVLVLISSVIVAAIVMINPDIVSLPAGLGTPREAITLSEAMLAELGPGSFPCQWLPPHPSRQGDELLFEEAKNLNAIVMPPGERAPNRARPFAPNISTLVSNSSLLSSIDYQGFKLSPSRRYLLVWTAKRRQFRHTFSAKYFLYDIQLDLISLLSTRPAPVAGAREQLDAAAQYLNEQDEGDERSRFQLVEWVQSAGVGSSRGDSLLMVQSNDIFLLTRIGEDQAPASPARLTFTGKAGVVFNGVPDWLYEEEILADTSALQMSPNASSLAYMSFNDSQVGLMPFSIYGASDQVIPRTQQIRYPKTGRVNPLVSVHIVDGLAVGERHHIELRLPNDLAVRQHYINRIKWLSEDTLALVWLNRNQNESYFVLCSRQQDWGCDINLHLRSEAGWLELSDDLYPLDEDFYLALLFKDEGPDCGAFKHIAKISTMQRDSFTFVTSGRREVVSIDGVDKRTSVVYYTASVEGEPGQRQTYLAHLDRPERSACLTCDHHPDECLYNFVKMSPSTDYYIFECDGPGVPRTELRSTPKHPPDTEWQVGSRPNGLTLDNMPPSGGDLTRKRPVGQANLLWTIEDNQVLKDKLTYVKAMPLTLRLRVPIPQTNYSANVLMLLPPQLGTTGSYKGPTGPSARVRGRPRRSAIPFQPGLERPLHAHFTAQTIGEYTKQLPAGQQYPMVVDVYGGPGSQKVDYRFSVNFGHYLASNRRTIYAMIDGRGSGYEGTRRLYELYHKFGTVEIQDQIETAAQLVRNFSFIDPNKVAIWGWSYGGYAAAMALAQSNALSLQEAADLRSLNSTLDSPGSIKSPTPHSSSARGVFECAVSVAPVTSWIYYDTAYTERYMSSPYQSERYDNALSGDHSDGTLARELKKSTPDELINKWIPMNQTIDAHIRAQMLDLTKERQLNSLDLNERYKKASLLEHIANVDRKRFLLIHGTADDNVHFQQSIMLMKKLIQRNIMFETRVYPDQDHGIASRPDKLHLGSTLSNFFAECFDMAY